MRFRKILYSVRSHLYASISLFQQIQVEDNLSICYGVAVPESALRNYSITG